MDMPDNTVTVDAELQNVVNQIAANFSPQKIILFGSLSRGEEGYDSDIDLCVIAETDDKRKLLADMYYMTECERPIDFLLYTPEEWRDCIEDSHSFAYKVNAEGIMLFFSSP